MNVLKHFKSDDLDAGPDSSFSLTPSQLQSLVEDCNNSWKALGSERFERSEAEKANAKFRRSLYFVKDLLKGHLIKDADIKRIRPGYGLAPKYYSNVIGSRLAHDVEQGDRVTWDSLLPNKTVQK